MLCWVCACEVIHNVKCKTAQISIYHDEREIILHKYQFGEKIKNVQELRHIPPPVEIGGTPLPTPNLLDAFGVSISTPLASNPRRL